MGWFSRSKADRDGVPASKVGAAAPDDAVACPHQRLAPRWDRAEDMGNPAAATSFVCEKCHLALTPAEGQALLAQRV